ncbi:putative G-type lectin S-receptor-like serine/threonine-protein kinase At1g61610 [Miscanthus floridulus]|uniref:putative G-type lectin S-receptor-like serine/threonine-protein kinase At1g61610 n=1 Tax=Miscanthus floridulus TaxID=154761 RepID=UPI003457CE6C
MDRSAAVLLLLLLLPPPCAPEDRLALDKPLSVGATIVSDGGGFALGFFSPTTNSTPANSKLYLGIWYADVPTRTVVWVANRDAPATNSTAPTLSLTNTANLVLSDGSGRVLWTTNVTGVVVPSSSPSPTAVLLDTGNLVVRHPNGSTLWQSFEHPADSFLPGMKLRINYGTRAGERLVSWRTPDDPSPGSFAYAVDPDTALQIFLWNGTRPLMRDGPWTGFSVTSQYQANASVFVYKAVVSTDEEIYLTYTLSDGAARTRFVVTASGQYQLQSWSASSSAWAVLRSWPTWECNRYGHCGPYGYCDNTMAAPTCRCLHGFEPADSEEWTRGAFSQGCRRQEPLWCADDGFLALQGMKSPDRFVLIANRTSDECRAACTGNCSCVAYAYANLSTTKKTGDVTRCLVWAGDLIDTEKQVANLVGTDTLYIRLSNLDAVMQGVRRKSNNALRIALPTVFTSCILIITGIFLAWFKFKGKRGNNNEDNNNKISHGATGISDDLTEGSSAQDFELPFVKFEDIVAATHNFSEAYKIGQGGFGKVYKALIGGQEVAIKRLSKDSEQGAVEFRNEVILIAKLQHRNLVRLLGYSVEGGEKILIYEYLPNRSLDAILFDNSRKVLLDWPTRFNIIKGVARGLLYLHQDSRLTIVHRDLKAANVLLDTEMRPKIADFGMARIFNDNQKNANTRRVVGTYGYMAPEYAMEGIFSIKSDVYSFGVLIMELVTGIKRSTFNKIKNFPNLMIYAWNMLKEGKGKDLADPCIVDTCSLDEVLLCSHMALLCAQENPDDRPVMSSVVLALENGSTTLPPPNNPGHYGHGSSDMELTRDRADYSMNSLTLTNVEGR